MNMNFPNFATYPVLQPAVPQAERHAVVLLREGSVKHSLFLVDAHDEIEPWLVSLVPYFEPGMAIYGLACPFLGDPALPTVEALAGRLVEALRGVQPEGPYRIAGRGFGGLLAYEIAIQLTGLDQWVQFVGLIDPDLPGVPALPELAGRVPRRDSCDTARQAACAHARERYAVFPLTVPVHLLSLHAGPAGAESARQGGWHGWGAVMTGNKVERVYPPRSDGRGAEGVEACGGVRIEANVATDVIASNITMHADTGADLDTEIATIGTLLAKLLRDEAAARRRPPADLDYRALMTIQSGALDELALFCMPGAGDNVINFLPFADALGPVWTVHGLQPRGVDGELAPYTNVETAAEAYLRGIDAAQMEPSVPLHLVGHSFGGWVAFEVALRLQARGRRIASLTLLDSEAPDGDGMLGLPYTFTEVVSRLIVALEHGTGKSLGVPPQCLEQADEAGQWRLLHDGMKRIGLMPARSKPADVAGLVRTYGTALRTAYRPLRAYQGPVRLAWASDDALDELANMRAHLKACTQWRRFAPQLSSWRSPGNHYTMLKRPHVAALAEWWRDAQ
jgi:thioesterase domain-containing protein